jgi:hypothetical protein
LLLRQRIPEFCKGIALKPWAEYWSVYASRELLMAGAKNAGERILITHKRNLCGHQPAWKTL